MESPHRHGPAGTRGQKLSHAEVPKRPKMRWEGGRDPTLPGAAAALHPITDGKG